MSILILYVYLLPLNTIAQHDLTMPFMHNLLQATYSNPTLIPDHNVSVFIAPILPSVSVNIRNTGFSMKDLINKGPNGDSIYLPKILGKLKKHNYLYVGASVDLLGVRFKTGDNYWSFNVTEHTNIRMAYSDNFARFVVKGNHDPEFYQKTANFKGLGLNAVHYREYGVGFTADRGNWIFGGRAKLLFGKSNAYTSRTDVSVFSSDTLIKLNNDVILNTSFPENSDNNNATRRKYLLNNKNIGISLDGGAAYKVNEKILVTFAFNNIGFINWKSDVTNRRVNANVAYSGVKLQSIIFQQDNRPDKSNVDFDITNDSLSGKFEPIKSYNSYRMPLVGQTYLLGEYALDENSEVGFGAYAEYFQGIRTSYTVNYQRTFGHVFNVIGSYSVHNRTFTNIGLGSMLRLGPFKFYFVGDNLIGIARGTDARNFNLRFGMHLVFGKARTF